jgi:hypothetical protein
MLCVGSEKLFRELYGEEGCFGWADMRRLARMRDEKENA